MSFLKTLFILSFCLFSSLYAHKCVHNEMDVTLKVTGNHQHKLFTNLPLRSNYRNLRMAFDFTNIESASEYVQIYIRDLLMPPVQSFFEAALKIVPTLPASNLYVGQDTCGSFVTIPPKAWTVGYDSDIVIFVSAVYEPSAEYLARSVPCAINRLTNRPSVGAIIFNTAYIKLDMKDTTIESDLSTTLHEITHVLGFSKALYPRYIDPKTLQPLTGHIFNKTVNGIPTMVLNVPPLTQRLRAHFNCSTLEGAYLENEGGPGSFGAHFERRVFYNEFMTASDIKDARVSEFTLALFEGTGWYQADYSLAEPMTYGKNKGCEFLDTKCVNPDTKETSFKEFCSPFASRGVTWTRRGFGVCGAFTPHTNPSLHSEFDYWGNKTKVIDSFSDNCPQIQFLSSFDCEDSSLGVNALLDTYESYGIGSKAFMGTLSLDDSALSEPLGFCFKPKCLKKEDGGYELSVFFGGSDGGYVNCSAAGTVLAEDFGFFIIFWERVCEFNNL